MSVISQNRQALSHLIGPKAGSCAVQRETRISQSDLQNPAASACIPCNLPPAQPLTLLLDCEIRLHIIRQHWTAELRS